MMNSIQKIVAFGLVAAALAFVPSRCLAQDKPLPKDATAAKPIKKPIAGPFHGRLAALDKAGRTITVGKRTFQITSETKITKDGKPALLESGVVGEEVGGYMKPAEGGKLVATTVSSVAGRFTMRAVQASTNSLSQVTSGNS